jgi:guanylate kinase
MVRAGEIMTGDGYAGSGKFYADRWPDPNRKRILLEVTLDAALVVQKLFPKQTEIFFFRPTGTTEEEWRRFLLRRLEGRGTETPAQIQSRIDQGIKEIKASLGVPTIIPIFNEDTENSVLTIARFLGRQGY